MKTYRGFATDTYTGGRVVLVDKRVLKPRHNLRNHSPTGFNWGYAGSGPAQLALAILADCKGDEYALRHYQDFKFQRIALLNEDAGFVITEQEINEWCACQAQAA